MWRNTALTPKFFMLDARTLFPMLIFFFHMRSWTFYVAIIGVGLFSMLTRKGYSPIILFRLIRMAIAGKHKTVVDPVLWRRRCRTLHL